MTEPNPTPKARRGCLFYGCLTGIVCLVAMLVALLIGLHQLKKMVNQYTDAQPLPLPQIQMAQSDIDRVKREVDDFRQAIQAGRSASPLSLTGDEINALIANDPNFEALKGKVHVTIEGGRVKGQLSVPMDQLGLPRFRGRYLNGTATFAISLQNGALHIDPDQLLVKDKPLPAVYLDAIRKQDLAGNVNNNPDAAAALGRLQSIQIEDGKLVIVPKQNQQGQ